MIRTISRPLPALLGFWLLVLGCGGPPPEDPRGWPSTIVLGLVPSREANVLIETAGPLAAYLEERLGVTVEHFVPQDYTGLIEAMGAGQADIGLIPPFGSMMARDRYSIETILISVRDGSPTYHTQWMTRDFGLCESEPERRPPDDLLFCEAPLEVVRGKRVAFTDPSSASGYLFPAHQLLEAGIDPATDVQAVFLGGHDASALALLSGDVDVGVSYDDVRFTIEGQYPEARDEIVVFNRSPDIPNDGVTIRPGLPPDLKEAIKQAFLDFAAAEAAKPQAERVLFQIYEIDGFEEPPLGLFDPVERAFRELRDKVDVG